MSARQPLPCSVVVPVPGSVVVSPFAKRVNPGAWVRPVQPGPWVQVVDPYAQQNREALEAADKARIERLREEHLARHPNGTNPQHYGEGSISNEG